MIIISKEETDNPEILNKSSNNNLTILRMVAYNDK